MNISERSSPLADLCSSPLQTLTCLRQTAENMQLLSHLGVHQITPSAVTRWISHRMNKLLFLTKHTWQEIRANTIAELTDEINIQQNEFVRMCVCGEKCWIVLLWLLQSCYTHDFSEVQLVCE